MKKIFIPFMLAFFVINTSYSEGQPLPQNFIPTHVDFWSVISIAESPSIRLKAGDKIQIILEKTQKSPVRTIDHDFTLYIGSDSETIHAVRSVKYGYGFSYWHMSHKQFFYEIFNRERVVHVKSFDEDIYIIGRSVQKFSGKEHPVMVVVKRAENSD